MAIDLNGATAGAVLSISVIDDYVQELARIGVLPASVIITRNIGGQDFDISVKPIPKFEMAHPPGAAPYTRLVLTGTIEIRPAGDPNATPTVLPLDAKAIVALVQLPGDPVSVVGLQYQGADGTPAAPVTAADLDAFFASDAIRSVLENIQIDLVSQLVVGLDKTLFPDSNTAADWTVTPPLLMPAVAGTEDSFGVFVATPGIGANPAVLDSFMAPLTGFCIAYSRPFLDMMLAIGAQAKEGTTVDGAKILKPLTLIMGDDSMLVDGKGVRKVRILPDVDFTFKGPMFPLLVRGTTVITSDASKVVVDVDDSDEIFYSLAKWILTIGAGVLLLSGFGIGTALGIALWVTAVQFAWSADVEIGNAPNTIRDNLASSLGAQLTKLAEGLDKDTAVGQLLIDATPDHLDIQSGNMILFAQVLVKPLIARLRSAEYSKKLRRFAIFELEDGRRFRAQELARLMASGKVTVPGFHQVRGDYVRANQDDKEANNLLRQFKSNLTEETVLRNVRR